MKKALLITTTLGLTLFLSLTVANAQTPQEIAKTARVSTVSLTMDNSSYGSSYGSGFFVTPDQIATSYHVIEGASSGHVSPVLQKEEYPIVGITAIDVENDLVILKVLGAQGRPLSIGDSGTVKILDTIYVVGNPNEIEGTVTTSVISNRIGKNIS